MNTGSLENMYDIGAMRINIDADFIVDSIIRTDTNGTAAVRLRVGVLPLPSTIVSTVDDYEAAAGLVTYTLSGMQAGKTERQTYTLTGQMVLQSPWLGVPIMQTYSQPIESVLSYDADISGRASVHEPLGRIDPIVVLRQMGLRKGSLELWAGSHGRTKEILGSLKRGEVMMLRQPEHDGMDMYFVAESASIGTLTTGDDRSLFSVTVQYVEVTRPAGFIAAAPGWDFAQLAAKHPDFFTVATKYADFQSLALDEES